MFYENSLNYFVILVSSFAFFTYTVSYRVYTLVNITEVLNSTLDPEYLSVEGKTTYYPFNFRCRGPVALAFKIFELHPDIVTIAPREYCNVTFPSGAKVEIGEPLRRDQVKEKPTVVWRANDSVPYYTLIMQNADDEEYKKGTHAWYVVNIPGCDVDKGDTVLRYIEPCEPPSRDPMRIAFLVYEQPGKISMDEMDWDEDMNWWLEANDVMERYNLSYAKFGNFYTLSE